jgi:hypothetical protein
VLKAGPTATPGSGAVRPAAPAETAAAREWTRVDKSSVAELETFRRRHPTSPEAEYALARIEELRTAEDRKKQIALVARPPAASGPASGGPLPSLPGTTAAAALAGTWKGFFFYSNPSRRPVAFTLTLEVFGGICRGRTEEPNTFGNRVEPKLFANVECSLIAGSAPPRLALRKVYDGTGGQSHGVDYIGEVSPDGRSITGTWTLPGGSGRFSLSRQ